MNKQTLEYFLDSLRTELEFAIENDREIDDHLFTTTQLPGNNDHGWVRTIIVYPKGTPRAGVAPRPPWLAQ